MGTENIRLVFYLFSMGLISKVTFKHRLERLEGIFLGCLEEDFSKEKGVPVQVDKAGSCACVLGKARVWDALGK